MPKLKYVYEWCSFCMNEVQLKAKSELQVCPKCGHLIIPCCLCDCNKVDCNKCDINKASIKINKILDETNKTII